MNLSVCIIAKNEEKHIEKCMQCLSDKEVQIVVADTGSTDKTKEIAKNTQSSYMILNGLMILGRQSSLQCQKRSMTIY